MILQALTEYYDRKAADPDSDIAPEGFERKEIPFVIVIHPDGSFVQLEDTREGPKNKAKGKTFLLPRSHKRQGPKAYASTFLLWDHAGYLLQHASSAEQKDIDKATNQHKTWLKSLDELPTDLKADQGVQAILKFYDSNGVEAVKGHEKWDECAKLPSCNMTFRLANEIDPAPCRKAVQDYVRAQAQSEGAESADSKDEGVSARCLVTGDVGPIARTHTRTPINKDTKSLVAFQKHSGYDSYGKEQCYNAPVGKSAEFAYTTALNTLIKSSSRFLVGDAVTVCWSKRASQLEKQVVDFFNEPPKDDPDRGVEAVKALFKAVDSGALKAENDNLFFVLGLSPNSARIAVRFWHVDTVVGMSEKICRHFKDLEICRRPHEKEFLSLFRLLVSIAPLGKAENIPPNLAGEMMRTVLEGAPYPRTLLQAAVRRIRAEQEIAYPRAALIKGCLNRMTRRNNPQKQEEMKVSLDRENNNIGYCLGRLFAVLEKIQSEANPGINATIRDKFYGAASSTPVTVFGNLMRLKNHHLAKLENPGRRVNFERMIADIVCGIKDFPPHLTLDDQGRFAIGYYHQKYELDPKNKNKNEPKGESHEQ